MTPYEFSKNAGVTRGILTQNNGISEDNISRFLAYFPEVNIEWLMTGKGEMINMQTSTFNNKTTIMFDLRRFRQEHGLTQAEMAVMLNCGQPNVSAIEKAMRDLDGQQYEALCNKFGKTEIEKYVVEMEALGGPIMPGSQINYKKGAPYYNVDFIGGFDIVLNDQTVNPEYLIDFKAYNGATCWCNVTGHSMEPEINHGDIMALKRIEDLSFLPYGEIYAIVTTNGMRTIKRIGPGSDPETCSLIPANKSPEYGIQELPKNMICMIYQVLGCMKKF